MNSAGQSISKGVVWGVGRWRFKADERGGALGGRNLGGRHLGAP